jgi:hypothetical protein
MSDQVAEQGEEQDDAAAMASMMAGYNKTARAEPAPAEVSTEPPAEPENTEVANQAPPEPEPEQEQEPTVVSLADELKAFKAKVASSSSDPETVRKLHGEIGNINRTLKQLQAAPKVEAAPVEDELTAALKAAEESEFPELTAPLVKAMRAMLAKQDSTKQDPANIDEHVTKAVSKIRERDAIEALAEEHPDFETVRETPEFKAWEKTKAPEFQQRLRTTWNAAVVAKGLTEFKDSLKAKQKKQDRLAAAVVTPGASQQAKPSTLPDEEGLLVGYNKGPKRLNSR